MGTKIKRLYLIPILSKALDILELLEAEKKPLPSSRIVSALSDFQDQRLPDPKDLCSSRLRCADPGRRIPAGFAAPKDAIWVRRSERGNAVLRGGYH